MIIWANILLNVLWIATVAMDIKKIGCWMDVKKLLDIKKE